MEVRILSRRLVFVPEPVGAAPKQRVVCNLGRKDLLAAHLDALVRLLRGEPRPGERLRVGRVQATGA